LGAGTSPEEADWSLLVALWANYNRYLAHIIAHLPPAKLEVPIRIGQDEPVTLKFVAEDYLRHMVHHLGQIGAAATDASGPHSAWRGGTFSFYRQGPVLYGFSLLPFDICPLPFALLSRLCRAAD
jgi:hypothetical protein